MSSLFVPSYTPPASSGGVTDHGALTGLADDDHAQYLLAAEAHAADGWVDDTANTWTRTADQTFTVSGDRTAVFSKGTRLKWTQTTVKYGVVVASSHAAGTTTVTIATTTDYVLTAAAITDNYFSYAANPQDYPQFFNYTPVWTSSGTAPALGNGTLVGVFAIVGRQCFVECNFATGSTTTYGTGNYDMSLPVNGVANSPPIGIGIALDGGVSYHSLIARLSTASTTNFLVNAPAPSTVLSATVPFTWANGDTLQWTLTYRF